ncbi:SRPBCC family protein [Aeromicrobium alkaliterrae]|uniref:SRPBCC family protein n=1 Tax=Aeromicrobium alkaliterrae TaxID=302168 RepID=UPI0031D1E058
MPQVVARTWVPVAPEVAFAVSQTTGETRRRWDRFIRHQHLVDASVPAKGVRTFTRARVGPSMVSEYVSYRPPTSVGMTMVDGPWFFASFGGGWRFTPETRDGTAGCLATWKYTYAVRPAWLRRIAEPIGQWLLGREIHARIEAWAGGCVDPEVLRTLES